MAVSGTTAGEASPAYNADQLARLEAIRALTHRYVLTDEGWRIQARTISAVVPPQLEGC